MSALHVVVRPRPSSSAQPALAALTGLIDVVVDGVNLTARVGEGPAIDFLVDFSLGLGSVLTSKRTRVTVPLHTESGLWELALEASDEHVLLSVFRQTPSMVVAAFERDLRVTDLRIALVQAIQATLQMEASLSSSLILGLKAARRELDTLPERALVQALPRTPVDVSALRRGFKLSASAALRKGNVRGPLDDRLERSDLHAALVRGSLEFRYGPNQIKLSDALVFLDLERLLALADDALASLVAARPIFRRTQLSTARVSMRRGPGEGPLELKIEPHQGSRGFVALIPVDVFTRIAARVAIKLAQAICQEDPEQANNLRISGALRLAGELLEQLEPEAPDECLTNPQPDSYRRFVPRLRRASGMWEHGASMRFLPRWVATVPQIDLKATFLCGHRLIVGAANETACLSRQSGEIVWRQEFRSAASVVTPSGLVRIEPDGRLWCHDLDNGEVRFGLKMTPRAHGGATGAVLYGPGLPKLLALTEGDRQVSGIDLVSGEVRWRYTARRPAPYRVRRAGRLLVIGGGDPLLVAIDGVSGDLVWSLRSRLPFSGEVSIDHDTACVLSGSPGGGWLLHTLNPWSGERLWEVELDERPLWRAPLLTPKSIVVPTGDDESRGAVAFDRATGRKLWEQAPGLVQGTAAWLSVDDCVLVNGSRGVLLGLDANTGVVRFNHVFSSSCEADQPRRLEPVLRSGALFVPQESVHVLRPLSGEVLGTLPSDLVPDLIRVDERCDVYVAEESGHLAAFAAAPKLSLVR